MCVRVRVRVRVRVHACVCVCARACACACVHDSTSCCRSDFNSPDSWRMQSYAHREERGGESGGGGGGEESFDQGTLVDGAAAAAAGVAAAARAPGVEGQPVLSWGPESWYGDNDEQGDEPVNRRPLSAQLRPQQVRLLRAATAVSDTQQLHLCRVRLRPLPPIMARGAGSGSGGSL